MGRGRYIYRSMEWLNFCMGFFHRSVNIYKSVPWILSVGMESKVPRNSYGVISKKKTYKKKNRIWVLALTKSDFPFQQNQVLQILLAGGEGIQLTYTFIVPPLKKNHHWWPTARWQSSTSMVHPKPLGFHQVLKHLGLECLFHWDRNQKKKVPMSLWILKSGQFVCI